MSRNDIATEQQLEYLDCLIGAIVANVGGATKTDIVIHNASSQGTRATNEYIVEIEAASSHFCSEDYSVYCLMLQFLPISKL